MNLFLEKSNEKIHDAVILLDAQRIRNREYQVN